MEGEAYGGSIEPEGDEMTSPWTAPGQQAPSTSAVPSSAPPAPGAPRPGVQRELSARSTVFPLRPMGVGEILGAGAAIYRHRRGTVLGMTAVVLGIGFLLEGLISGITLVPSVLLTASMDAPEEMATLPLAFGGDLASTLATIGTWVLSALISLVCSQLVTLLLVRIAVDQVRDQDLPAAQLRGLMLRRAARAVAVGLLQSVLAVLPPLLLGGLGALPFVVLTNPSAWFALAPALGILLGLLVTAWIITRLVMAVPSIAVEDAGFAQALRRALALSRGSATWRLLGIGTLVTLLTTVAVQVISGIFAFIAVPVMLIILLATQGAAMGTATVAVMVLSMLGGYIATVVISPFTQGALAATYADTRMRLEGWDAELLAEQAAVRDGAPR